MALPVNGPVRDALVAVAAAMGDARDPWWVIGSAAVALHGVETDVADIDLLVSERDAVRLIQTLGLRVERPNSHPLFRSRLFARWPRCDRDVEIMAGLAVTDGTRWCAVRPATRVAIGGVFVPDRGELMAILASFGRAKDRARRDLLAGS